MVKDNFWKNKKVYITGHTGFKGSWLSLWLSQLGANVFGYALKPQTHPSLFELLRLEDKINSEIGDICEFDNLSQAIGRVQPDILLHLAAQPIVRRSYADPIETYQTNVMGTVHVLEAVRKTKSVNAVVNVTTDKCYENKGWHWGYRENEPMGGYDPYSNSKGCSELVTSSFRNSFFNADRYQEHGVALASARAGNVIGGGDWAEDRLVPDCMRSLLENKPILIRNPHHTRPWQHVLEPLSGYMMLAQNLFESGTKYAEGWNFGPEDSDAKPVEWIVQRICRAWDPPGRYELMPGDHPHEDNFLKLDCSKAKNVLKWHPVWCLEEAIEKTMEWYRAYSEKKNMSQICLEQIDEFCSKSSPNEN